jgi:hypothetical protein
MAKSIPVGWHSVTPRLVARDPSKRVEFLKRAFGASGDFTTERPSQIRIGDSIVMVSGATTTSRWGRKKSQPTSILLAPLKSKRAHQIANKGPSRIEPNGPCVRKSHIEGSVTTLATACALVQRSDHVDFGLSLTRRSRTSVLHTSTCRRVRTQLLTSAENSQRRAAGRCEIYAKVAETYAGIRISPQ